jgi:cytochrome c-type biogenesis protein CcmH/NrfF
MAVMIRNTEFARARPIVKSLRRFVPIVALAAAVVFSTGLLQGQSSDRAKRLGGKLICMCGCNQILTECNHVGCTMSGAMLKEMDQRVTANDSDDLILQSFVQEFGAAALAEPPTRGFNSLAWAIPGIAFALGLGLVVMVIRQWRHRVTVVPAAGPPVSPEMLARARREIDRQTDD